MMREKNSLHHLIRLLLNGTLRINKGTDFVHFKLIQNRRLLFYTIYLAYICVGIIGILPGPTLPILAEHTGVALDVAGWIFTVSAIGFIVGVAVAGLMSQKFGPKYAFISGLVIMASGGIVTSLTHSFWLLLIAQFVL